jgi:hypothetical protein
MPDRVRRVRRLAPAVAETRAAGQVTISVPFIPAASWPGTGQ